MEPLTGCYQYKQLTLHKQLCHSEKKSTVCM